MRYFIPVAFLALLNLGACQKPDSLTASEKEAIRSGVQQMLEDYCADIRVGGLSAEFKYLDASPDFFWVPPGYSSWLSYDSVAAILKQRARAYRSVDNRWETLRVDPLAHEYASYTGKLQGTTIDTAGSVIKYTLLETGIVVKRKEGWKLLRGHSSLAPEKP